MLEMNIGLTQMFVFHSHMQSPTRGKERRMKLWKEHMKKHRRKHIWW